tara:strand:+ start:47 stop:316 length:270 start_codon:yes stop_codon:yes gene_type:complete
MSGHSYSEPCPNCGGNMWAYSDYKPFKYESGECHECGFFYHAVANQMDLVTLNECRVDENYHDGKLEPLKKLPKIKKWLKEYLTKGAEL